MFACTVAATDGLISHTATGRVNIAGQFIAPPAGDAVFQEINFKKIGQQQVSLHRCGIDGRKGEEHA